LAGSAQAYHAACHRAGALMVDTLQEQCDVTNALASQPLPQDNRVAILTNAGGPAALAADSLDKYGLRLADLTTDTKNRLQPLTPAGTQLNNPVDMLGGPQGVMYRDAGKVLLQDPGVDMLISIYVPQALTPVMDVAQGVVDSAQSAEKPVVCCMVGGYSIGEAVRLLNSHSVPFYEDPNRASFALSGLYRYQLLRQRDNLSSKPISDVSKEQVKILLGGIQQKEMQYFLTPQQAADIIHAYCIQVPDSGIASSTHEATSLAEEIGYPVALKLVAEGITHKTEAGGVALNVEDTAGVQQAYKSIVGDNLQYRALVQSMAAPGVEVIVGFQRDAQFGPVLMFGTGGIAVEVNQDVSFRLAPLCRHDAQDMIAETAVGQMLQGIRGGSASDVDSLVDVLQRVGQLASDFPSISELDINPLIVYEKGQGCIAVDVRMVVQAVQKK
jgi:acyl-CoA synthetase (NDP forming)